MKYVFLGATLIWGLLSMVAWAIQPKRVNDGKIRIVWATDDNPARQEQMQMFERMFPQYDIVIDPANYNRAKIIVQTIGGVGPDVFDFGGPAALRAYVEAGIIWDITDKVQEYGIDYRQCWPSAWSSMVMDGRQYSFPCNSYGNALFYHRDLFRQAGVPEPKGDWTWAQFLETSKKLTRRTPDGRRIEQFGVMGMDWRELVNQNGGRFFTPDGKKCIIDSPEAIEAVQFYYDLMGEKYHVSPSPADLAAMSNEGGWGTGGVNIFGAKRVAMFRIGRWALVKLREFKDLDLGVCPLPYNKQKYTAGGARVTGINRKSPVREHALNFLKFLASQEYNEQINHSADSISGVKRFCLTDTFLRDPDYPKEAPYNKLWLDVMEYSYPPEVSPYISPFRVDRIMNDEMDLMVNGILTPQKALSKAAAMVNKEMQENLEKYPELRARYEKGEVAPAP